MRWLRLLGSHVDGCLRVMCHVSVHTLPCTPTSIASPCAHLPLAAITDEGQQLAVTAHRTRQPLSAQQDAGARLPQELVFAGIKALEGAGEEIQPTADRLGHSPDQALANALDKPCSNVSDVE